MSGNKWANFEYSIWQVTPSLQVAIRMTVLAFYDLIFRPFHASSRACIHRAWLASTHAIILVEPFEL